jgi:hypothetical protein
MGFEYFWVFGWLSLAALAYLIRCLGVLVIINLLCLIFILIIIFSFKNPVAILITCAETGGV